VRVLRAKLAAAKAQAQAKAAEAKAQAADAEAEAKGDAEEQKEAEDQAAEEEQKAEAAEDQKPEAKPEVAEDDKVEAEEDKEKAAQDEPREDEKQEVNAEEEKHKDEAAQVPEAKQEEEQATPATAKDSKEPGEQQPPCQEQPDASKTQELPTGLASILGEGEAAGLPPTPAQIPGTPVFAGLVKAPGREAPAAIAAAGHAVQRAYAGPVSRWMISLSVPAMQHYVFKHPQVVDMTDHKLWKYTESFAAKADLETVKISTFLSSLERRFGEQLQERKPRQSPIGQLGTIRILKTCLNQRMQRQRQQQEQQPEPEPEEEEPAEAADGKKSKVKKKAKAKPKPKVKGMECQKERRMIEPASKKKKTTPEEDPEHVSIEERDDLVWAVRVLAPFGMTEIPLHPHQGGELVVKPPVGQVGSFAQLADVALMPSSTYL
ncbi:unnamed protein product, partial [Symbiodinium natans]